MSIPSMPPLETALAGKLPDISAMGRMIFDPIWQQSMHRSGHYELIHVIRGRLTVILPRRQIPVGPGETVLIPINTRHRDDFDLAGGLEVFMVSFTWSGGPVFFKALGTQPIPNLAPATVAEISRIVHRLQTDFIAGGVGEKLVARAHLLTLLLLLLRESRRQRTGENRAALRAFGDRRRKALMMQARHYLESHYAEPLTLENIAHALNVSAYYLSHVFSEENDFTLFAYLTTLRMEKARALLRDGRQGVAEIARSVGYDNSNYFSKVFRRHFGFAPRAACDFRVSPTRK
jgi:AraC-like DNA-binding protein